MKDYLYYNHDGLARRPDSGMAETKLACDATMLFASMLVLILVLLWALSNKYLMNGLCFASVFRVRRRLGADV